MRSILRAHLSPPVPFPWFTRMGPAQSVQGPPSPSPPPGGLPPRAGSCAGLGPPPARAAPRPRLCVFAPAVFQTAAPAFLGAPHFPGNGDLVQPMKLSQEVPYVLSLGWSCWVSSRKRSDVQCCHILVRFGRLGVRCVCGRDPGCHRAQGRPLLGCAAAPGPCLPSASLPPDVPSSSGPCGSWWWLWLPFKNPVSFLEGLPPESPVSCYKADRVGQCLETEPSPIL